MWSWLFRRKRPPAPDQLTDQAAANLEQLAAELARVPAAAQEYVTYHGLELCREAAGREILAAALGPSWEL